MIYLLEERVFFIFQEVVKKYGKRVIFPSILLLILIFYFFFTKENSTNEQLQLISSVPEQSNQENNENTINTETSEKVIIDIKGAVQFPGVYELTTNDRIIDAINQAGGYTKDAETTGINHAQKLQDEMVIYIPKKGEDVTEQIQKVQNQSMISNNIGGSSSSSNGKVNINTANESELTTLSGIGPSKAQAIIAYREEHGPYKSIDDIKNVSGIGEKTFEKLKDSITVN